MAGWVAVADSLWAALGSLDVDPVQTEAERDFCLALIGAPGSGKTALACTLAGEPPGQPLPGDLACYLPEYRLPLAVDDITELESATLLVLLLDATTGDYVQEVAAADYLAYLGRPMLVCYNKMDLVPVETQLIRKQARWRGAQIVPLTATKKDTAQELLVPKVLEAVPECALTLARHLPLFRQAVADHLIGRTAQVNAAFASASGLPRMISLTRMPLRSSDVAVLGANQAMMAYRLALAYGLPFDWHESARGVHSAVDVTRVWQRMARQVVGVIPLWGPNAKVRLAFGGTLLTARAFQEWYESGQALSPQTLRALSRQAAFKSKSVSDELVAKARDALPAARRVQPGGRRLRARLASRRRKPRCLACGRTNPVGASFCAYCGVPLEQKEQPSDRGSDG
jgi:uncharacterized protein (DUF697 family)